MVYLEELYVVPDRRGEGHGLDADADRDAGGARARRHHDGAGHGGRATATPARLYEGLGFTNLEKAGDPESQMLYYEREL